MCIQAINFYLKLVLICEPFLGLSFEEECRLLVHNCCISCLTPSDITDRRIQECLKVGISADFVFPADKEDQNIKAHVRVGDCEKTMSNKTGCFLVFLNHADF